MFAHTRFFWASWLISILCACGWTLPTQAAISDITPNEVFSEALQIEKEIDLLKHHFNITVVNPNVPIEADLQPRHVWQRAYVILLKLSVFRRKHGLPSFAPLTFEPALKLEPAMNWGQTQRILTELRIIKKHLGMSGEVSPANSVQGKQSIDVFNKLDQIAFDLDNLNGEPINPSYVYAEVQRINEDVNSIMRNTGTFDNAVPPPKNPNVTPKDSLHAAFVLMDEVQRLQRQLGLDITNFSVFHKTDNVVPSEVFRMVTLCLAELQIIKAKLGILHNFTPAAEFYEGKTPVQVVQLLGYVANKLHLVDVK